AHTAEAGEHADVRLALRLVGAGIAELEQRRQVGRRVHRLISDGEIADSQIVAGAPAAADERVGGYTVLRRRAAGDEHQRCQRTPPALLSHLCGAYARPPGLKRGQAAPYAVHSRVSSGPMERTT